MSVWPYPEGPGLLYNPFPGSSSRSTDESAVIGREGRTRRFVRRRSRELLLATSSSHELSHRRISTGTPNNNKFTVVNKL